jgi:hypothetical protein
VPNTQKEKESGDLGFARLMQNLPDKSQPHNNCRPMRANGVSLERITVFANVVLYGFAHNTQRWNHQNFFATLGTSNKPLMNSVMVRFFDCTQINFLEFLIVET